MALPSVSNTNVELEPSSPQLNGNEVVDDSAQQVKRNNSRGIRVVGNRIYDSSHGKTCHQCRQKTRDFAATCKNPRNGKPCVIRFCLKCLLNRYGENAEEVEQLNDWICPKCRGICNCSCCMKRRGQQPTGALAHTAKASGFKSVSEMLSLKASENLESNKVSNAAVLPSKEATLEKEQNCVDNLSSDKVLKGKTASPITPIASDKELAVILSGEPEKENSIGGNNGLKPDSLKVQKTSPEKSKNTKRKWLKEISNGNSVDDACDNKNLKRRKICNGIPEGETKRNAHVVSERKTKVDKDNGIVHAQMDGPQAWAANDFFSIPNHMDEKNCKAIVVVDNDDDNASVKSQTDTKVLHAVSEKETAVDKNQDIVDGVKDGPEAWAKNDFFLDLVALASNGLPSKPNPYGVKEEMHQKNLNGTVAIGDGDNDDVKSQTGMAQSLKFRIGTVNSETEKIEEEIPLPPGTEITEISDIEFPPEDVGNALQFLEFCRAFGKALDLKKGEAEAILRELVRKQNLRRGQNTLVVQFQIRLLTLILTDLGIESPSLTTTNGDNSWLKALEDLITESDLVLKDFPWDWLEEGLGGYYDLDLSQKLTLLNFICDEALVTEKLRSYIDEENIRFAAAKKEVKSKVAAAKGKEKSLKQKLQDEMAKAVLSNVTDLSVSEHDALLAEIKREAALAHTQMLEAKNVIPKRKQSSDAMRTEPEFSDSGGQTFWKLKSYNGDYAVLMQDIKIQDADATATDERWFVYGPEKKDEIDKYISSRAKRSKTRKVPCILSNESSEANM